MVLFLKFLTDLTSDDSAALQLEDKDLVLFVAVTLEVAGAARCVRLAKRA